MSTLRSWLITGVSSGFGLAVAEAALERGDAVIGTVRKAEQAASFSGLASGRSTACVIDMTDRERLARTVRSAIECAGRVDVVVNNAGYGLAGAAEELSDAEIRHQMETNFFALVTVTQAALPFMRRQRSGHIVNIASMAGFSGIPGMSIYSASKFAVVGFTEALAAETAHLGIRATSVEPGQFRTNWSSPNAIARGGKVIDDYALTAGMVRQSLAAADGLQPGDPVKAAQAILQIVDAAHPPLHLPLGQDAVGLLRHAISRRNEELEAWLPLSLGTSFDSSNDSASSPNSPPRRTGEP